jgi:hypothetical protein
MRNPWNLLVEERNFEIVYPNLRMDGWGSTIMRRFKYDRMFSCGES